MKRFFRGAFSFFLFLVIASLFLSNFIFQESFEKLELEFAELAPALQNQAQKLSFAVDLAYTSQYDYVFLHKKGGYPVDKIQAFLPVDVNLLHKLKTHYIILNLDNLPVFATNGEIRKDYLLSLKNYYDSVIIPSEDEPKKLKLAAIRFINPFDGRSFGLAKLDNFLEKQFKIASLFYTGHSAGSVIIPCGMPLDNPPNKNMAISQVAKQIFDSWRLVERENEVKLQVLLVNTHSSANLALCQSLTDVKAIIQQIKQLNLAFNRPIASLEDRIGFALDTSGLYSVWYDRNNSYYKDKKNSPLSYSAFWEEIKKDLADNNRPLVKFILASFYSKDEKEGYHLPYSRSKDSRAVLEQLKFLVQVIQYSNFSPESNFLSLEIPLRELFPVIHRVAKPLAKAWGLYRKQNGADKSEFIYSHELLEKYLAFNLN